MLLETQLSKKGLEKVLTEFGRGWCIHVVHAQERFGGILLMIKENIVKYNYLGGNKQALAVEIEDDNQQK